MKEYVRRKLDYAGQKVEALTKEVAQDKYDTKFMKYLENRGYQRDLKVRVAEKIKAYDASIDKRRERCEELGIVGVLVLFCVVDFVG